MRIVVTLSLLLLAAGCTMKQIDTAREVVRQTIATFCTTYPSAHAAFQGYAATGRVSAANLAREAQAVRAAQSLCADPPSDTRTALGAASRILASLVSIETEARRQATGS